jgi:Flp pilus assembly protein TadB
LVDIAADAVCRGVVVTGTALISAALAVAACFVALGGGPVRDRLATVAARRVARSAHDYGLLGSAVGHESPVDAALAERATQQRTARLQVVACLVAAVAIFLLIGGVMGALLAVGVAVAGPRILRRLEPGDNRRRRVQIEVSAAMVADLLAACLASGASTPAATSATASAIGGPSAELLNQCVAQFELGADHRRVWAPLMAEPALAPIARAILRSAETGAPLTSTLLRVGDDLRSTRKAHLDQAAQAVGVKAVGPLGLCFLPAFMLLGVVPLIASLIANGLE